jgi:hypothetical protein
LGRWKENGFSKEDGEIGPTEMRMRFSYRIGENGDFQE